MTHLRHYLKITRKILASSYSYGKINVFYSYFRLVAKSIVYHKITSRSKRSNSRTRNEKLLGFTVQFYGYPELINLFEEIFIYQVYKFASAGSSPAIIDCGSNIGLSILYFKSIYPLSSIVAFEPDEESFSLLKENIHNNNLSQVLIYNLALSDKEEDLQLYKTPSSPGSLTTSLIRSTDKIQSRKVHTKKLSDYITDKVDLIKIDVEGSELRIMDDLIQNKKMNHIEKFIIEYHPSITHFPIDKFCNNINEAGFSFRYTDDKLNENATEVMIYCGRNTTKHESPFS